MLTASELKAKQRELRDGFPESLGLRVHRAISWLQRASADPDDPDVAFILLWIAFNASYAEDQRDHHDAGEREVFSGYFELILGLDEYGHIYNAIWSRFSDSIRALLDNKYIFQPYWNHLNGIPGYDGWEVSFEKSKHKVKFSLNDKDTVTILSILFDRLYVLRNQLIHGGATWNSKVNRDQVNAGKDILEFLLSCFINIMMDNPEEPWGKPYYPVVND